MAVGIGLAYRVHTVSLSYARDIRQPSRKPQFYGGEGLEADLEQVHREGQPCLVHAVGGLKDTDDDGRYGFTFSGDTIEKQVDDFVCATLETVALKRRNPAAWEKIRKNAAATRFRWKEAADRYVQELYR